MADSVKVAVRVRPFNQRELKANPHCIISMRGQSTFITNPADKSEKSFSFDHSYWSHDGFKLGEDGVSRPDSEHSPYADQRKVFDDLGRGVLDNAWQGYNAALFAYGQTGSGKSYSMIGYNTNRGIVPITCSELFKAINDNKDTEKKFQVTFSMLEIYNEQVRDLLVSTRGKNQKSKASLRVRMRPGQGFYCEGLKQVPVQSYADIERLMDDGVVNRTTASTSMNATSSRSHMVITISFKQVFPNEQGQSTTKTSEISLVDLAGSERAASTEATGDRLKEGSLINTSLLNLGNVIRALAEASVGKKKVNIPYRNSVLTKLLQSALGGNSKTVMIAALSPAAINYEETLSTLRYADRAKQIKTRAVINENLTDKLIRELRAENQRLIDQLKKMNIGSGGVSGDKGEDVQKLLQENQRQLQDMNLSWEQRLEEARKEWESQEVTSEEMPGVWRRTPYITNVNEDPQLSGVIRFPIVKGDSLLGKPGAVSVTIEMRGLGIQNHHAIISNTGKGVSITQGNRQASITVNGKALNKDKIILKHLDRIKLGSNNLYLYVGFPAERPAQERPLEVYTYDVFQAELAEVAGISGHAAGAEGEEADPELVAMFEQYISLQPRVMEVNAMSQELAKGVTFQLEVKNLATHDKSGRAKDKQVIVCLQNKNNKVWVWSKEKFLNRKYMMETQYNRWLDGEDLSTDQELDPFWDPLEDIFIGSAHVWLTGLGYCMETDDQLDIRDYRGREVGQLQVKLTPCDVTGHPLEEEMLVMDPNELLSSRLDFLVSVSDAARLKWSLTDPSRGSFCRFTFYKEKETMVTKAVWGNANPRYNFTKQLTVSHIDKDFLNYLESNALVVEVWGTQVGTDPSTGTSVAIQRPAAESETETVVLYLQEKLRKQELELSALRREHALLNQENARLQRVSLSPGNHQDPRRRKSVVDDGRPVVGRRPSTDQGRQRKVGVFLPNGVRMVGAVTPFPRRESISSPAQVTYIDLNTGGEPMRPSTSHIIPTARSGRRMSSTFSPIPPAITPPASHRVTSPQSAVTTPPTGASRNQQQQQKIVATPGRAEKDKLNEELVKALKMFFKEMKDVERRTKKLRKIGEETRATGENGNTKTAVHQQQEGLAALESAISTNLAGLKDTVRSVIRRRHQEDT